MVRWEMEQDKGGCAADGEVFRVLFWSQTRWPAMRRCAWCFSDGFPLEQRLLDARWRCFPSPFFPHPPSVTRQRRIGRPRSLVSAMRSCAHHPRGADWACLAEDVDRCVTSRAMERGEFWPPRSVLSKSTTTRSMAAGASSEERLLSGLRPTAHGRGSWA